MGNDIYDVFLFRLVLVTGMPWQSFSFFTNPVIIETLFGRFSECGVMSKQYSLVENSPYLPTTHCIEMGRMIFTLVTPGNEGVKIGLI